MRKCLLLGLIVLLLSSLGSLAGCETTSVTGIYVNEDNPSEVLELYEDGSYYLEEGGLSLHGEWEIEGKELRFYLMGIVATAEIKGNKIYDEDGKVWIKQSSSTSSEETNSAVPEQTQISKATLEVANFNLAEVIELCKVIDEVMTSARLIASEEERSLLSKASVIIDQVQPDSTLHDIVGEKTEEERLILDVLGGIFDIGAESFLKIPSPVALAITRGAEELGNQIAKWQVLGDLGHAMVTLSDTGVMNIIYHKEEGEVWVNFDFYDPVDRVVLYIPIESRLVSPEGSGNIILSDGIIPVVGNSRIMYRFGEATVSVPVPKPAPGEGYSQFVGTWINVDTTGGITRVNIISDTGEIFIHMWGNCLPSDCDWGEERANLSDSTDGVIYVTWDPGFAIRTQELSLLSDGRLKVESHTHFTDNSGRSDYDSVYYFSRDEVQRRLDPTPATPING